jgi:hypothetical protein
MTTLTGSLNDRRGARNVPSGVAEGAPEEIIVARDPRWTRAPLATLAALYFALLVYHPTDLPWARPVTFFTEATCLFPRAAEYAIEFRLEAWGCGRRWEPLDPRPYFPIRPDDKESRLQRFGYFYERNDAAMTALDAFVTARHASGADDGVTGRIGGVRLYKALRRIPDAGAPVERYQFDWTTPVARDERREIYYTPGPERRRRCAAP